MTAHGKRPARAGSGRLTLPPDLVRAVLKGHSALGLAFAAALYLICLTGSIAVFAQEFQRWEQAGRPLLTTLSPAAAQRAVEGAIARAGGVVEHGYIQMPTPALPLAHVGIEAPDGTRRIWLTDGNGALVAEGATPWTDFLTALHINLHLPRTWGGFLVGLSGVALLSSLISGVLAHPRIFRDAFHLRLGGSRRLQEADLHNRLGVWALPFHLTVSLTGALLGLTTIIVGVLGMALFQGDAGKVYALFLPAAPKEDPRPAPVIDLRPMFARVAAQAPDGRVETILIDHPTEAGGAATFQVERDLPRLARGDSYGFDRQARLYHVQRATENNLGQSILAAIGPLHFGWFGGGVVKVAYALLGLGLAYLAAGGVTIWLARRRDKGRAAPRWERIWAGVVWGQPAALGSAALAAVALHPPVGALVAVWGAASLLAIAASAWLRAPVLSRTLALATGIVVALTGLAHAVMRPGGDAVAWTVDAVLLTCGVALCLYARRRFVRRI